MRALVLALLIGAVALWPRPVVPGRSPSAMRSDAPSPARRWTATFLRAWRHDWRRGPSRLNPQAEFADALALALRSGLPGPAAWDLAAATVPDGEPPLGADDVLSRAWRMSHELGAPLVGTIESVALTLRSRSAAQARQRVLLAGPKASMLLLTLLPIAGPILAPLVGLNVLTGNGIGRFSVPAGLFLTVLGWWWSRGILRRAARPVVVLTRPS